MTRRSLAQGQSAGKERVNTLEISHGSGARLRARTHDCSRKSTGEPGESSPAWSNGSRSRRKSRHLRADGQEPHPYGEHKGVEGALLQDEVPRRGIPQESGDEFG